MTYMGSSSVIQVSQQDFSQHFRTTGNFHCWWFCQGFGIYKLQEGTVSNYNKVSTVQPFSITLCVNCYQSAKFLVYMKLSSIGTEVMNM
jgi:hypothetical protein